MKKKLSFVLAWVLTLTTFLTACSGGNSEPVPEPPKELSGKLTIWTDGNTDSLVKTVTKAYPNVKVNVHNMPELEKKLKEVIEAGTGGPDLVFISPYWVASNNMSSGLENLLDLPYNASQLKDLYPEASWNYYQSLDGKKMFSLPLAVSPMMTIYRPDILEENGYPSDPKELAEYMSTPENFLDMALALKAKGIYLLQDNRWIMDLYLTGGSMFDRNLNFTLNTDKYAEGLRLAQQVKQLGLALNQRIWTDQGKLALAAGKLAMLFMGTSYLDFVIKDAAPDSLGKWKVTHLPFGKALAGNGDGRSFAILSQSKNKELAWECIKIMQASDEGAKNYIAAGGLPAYQPAWSFPEFKAFTTLATGDQKVNEIMAEAAAQSSKNEPIYDIPLSPKTREIWNNGMDEAIEKNKDPKTAIQQIANNFEKAANADIDKLKAEYGIQ
jgi:multiple sugar transport system substrate-binding protein